LSHYLEITVSSNTPEKRLIQAGRRTRDALRVLRDIVRRERKKDLYNQTFAELDEAIEDATDGLIEISAIFEHMLQDDYRRQIATSGDVADLQALQDSLASMKEEREELIHDLQAAQKQLQKYADDLQTLYAQERAKRAELALAYERLQQADRLKSDFLSTITHELSSPLVPVDLSLQLVGRGSLSHDQQDSLAEAQKLLLQYKRQVDGIIKYASLVSQSHPIIPKPISVQTLLEDTLDPLIRLAEGRRIQVTVLPFDEALEVTADRDLLSSAVYQIVHNAIKFNHAGGAVEIEVGRQMGNVVFMVTDNGSGIPDEIMQHLGQDFNQIVDSLRRGVEGLGLGLALANYVASVHSGQLVARRGASDVGTVIQLWIPSP
jgi:signal transduction histidine kinase